jgi:photosystem II stability/assembly factor-like uncharacterized protein
MKTLIITLFTLILIPQIGFSQTTWYNQISGTNSLLFDVHFVDQNNGWAAGNTGLILHTSDGGANWNQQTAPPTNSYYSIFFTDTQNGWASGYSGKIIHTSDGGNNWVEQSSGSNRFLLDLFFLNPDTGWISGGDHGTFPSFINHREILFTSNGGNTWISQYNQSNEAWLYSIYFLDNNDGYATGEVGAIMHTSNGGNNWTEETTLFAHEFLDIFFTNENNGWVVGQFLGLPHVSVIFNTTDGGVTWDSLTFGMDENLASIYFADDLNGWAVGGTSTQSSIYHTTNGGINWLAQNSPTNDALFGVHFVDNNNGWAVGSNGAIITTQNPVGVEDPLQLVEYELLQNYPNPFNPTTTIKYSLPSDGFVKLSVFNALGEEVSTLVNEFKSAGSYEINFSAIGGSASGGDAHTLPSGIYFYKIQAGDFIETKKMLLLK